MASPGSVVEIDKHTVEFKIKGKSFEKECFRRTFVCFKACWQGFLDGCRPYLAIDASHLTGRWRGQLVAAYTVDGHNWLFPVAFGVVEAESEESWVWFLQQLCNIIGTPPSLAIHIDACKGLESAVDIVFPGVEHRECMRHLAQNFKKKFPRKVYVENLWPASYTCSQRKHEHHLRVLYAQNPLVKQYMDAHHGRCGQEANSMKSAK
jgi:transposase-like protein